MVASPTKGNAVAELFAFIAKYSYQGIAHDILVKYFLPRYKEAERNAALQTLVEMGAIRIQLDKPPKGAMKRRYYAIEKE